MNASVANLDGPTVWTPVDTDLHTLLSCGIRGAHRAARFAVLAIRTASLALVIVAGSNHGRVWATDPAEVAPDRAASGRVAKLKMTVGEESIALVTDPLLRYTDPTRATNGTVWAFGQTGRPLALLTLTDEPMLPEEGPPGGRKWFYEFVSLTDDPLRVAGGKEWGWRPQPARLRTDPLADAPPPADSDRLRSRQMRLLSRQFAVTEEYMGESYELRLLERPVLRYSDPDRGLIDGGLFAFAHGTNPETILLLEAVRTSDGPRWRYGFARMGSATLTARIEQRDVWSVETYYASNAKETESYNAFYEPELPVAKPTEPSSR